MEAGHTAISTLTRQHALPDGELSFLGGHASVTGVMTRVVLGRGRLLIDCGSAQGLEAHEWRLSEAALDVDAVVLTQAHEDHAGSLPALLARGFRGPVYGTPATLGVLRSVLEERLSAQEWERAEARGLLEQLRVQLRALPRDVAFEVGGVRCTLREAGYMPGSASVELVSAQSRVICSGDLGRPGAPLLPGYEAVWEKGRDVDLVVMECRYGGEEHAGDGSALQVELERIVLRAAERRGHLLVPAGGLGGAQTLLWHLDALCASGRIPPLPVALDGRQGVAFAETYAGFARAFDRAGLARLERGEERFDFERWYGPRQPHHRARLSEVPGPLLIIAGNELCTGGRIVSHLRRSLPLEQATLLFLERPVEGTPARAIQRAAARGGRVWLDHEEVRVRAEVETLTGLSAHADRRGLARWLGALGGVRRVALHHGEPKAQRAFAEWYGGAPERARVAAS